MLLYSAYGLFSNMVSSRYIYIPSCVTPDSYYILSRQLRVPLVLTSS